jgi:hypothetical protein
MASTAARLARVLGILVLVLAWTSAALEYNKTGEVPWSRVFAGVVFVVLPFASGSFTKRS